MVEKASGGCKAASCSFYSHKQENTPATALLGERSVPGSLVECNQQLFSGRLKRVAELSHLMNFRHLLHAFFVCFVTAAVAVAQNQTPRPPTSLPAQQLQPTPTVEPLPQDANQYVRQAIQHEMEEQDRDHTHWRYRYHKEEERYSYDRDVIETSEGKLSRTLLWNGQPLDADGRKKDEERMHQMLSDPEERAKRAKREKDDGEKAQRLLKAIPEAFVFRYDGEEEGTIRLTFTPNPHYSAPNRELQVLHSLSGKIWIDRASNRLARVEGALIEDVSFGLGLLGRLNKGGTFKVVQQQVGPAHWEVVALDINMTGRAVIFKTINVKQREQYSDFRRVPDSLTLGQAYEILQKDPNPVSASSGGDAHPQAKN
jgi:hypothetical protein